MTDQAFADLCNEIVTTIHSKTERLTTAVAAIGDVAGEKQQVATGE